MWWQRTFSSALIVLLLAASAGADVMPFFGGRSSRPPRWWIELSVSQLPKGMVLLFVDEKDTIGAQTNGKQAMIIRERGTLYLARESQLSKPFSFNWDSEKLIKVRKVTDGEIPRSYGSPMPAIMHCKVTGKGPADYALSCDDGTGNK